MSAELQNLLACPFCGGDARVFGTQSNREFQAHAQCKNCGAEIGSWLPWETGAVEQINALVDVANSWNVRADAARVIAAEKVVEALAACAKDRAADAPEWDDRMTVLVSVSIGTLRDALAAYDEASK